MLLSIPLGTRLDDTSPPPTAGGDSSTTPGTVVWDTPKYYGGGRGLVVVSASLDNLNQFAHILTRTCEHAGWTTHAANFTPGTRPDATQVVSAARRSMMQRFDYMKHVDAIYWDRLPEPVAPHLLTVHGWNTRDASRETYTDLVSISRLGLPAGYTIALFSPQPYPLGLGTELSLNLGCRVALGPLPAEHANHTLDNQAEDVPDREAVYRDPANPTQFTPFHPFL